MSQCGKLPNAERREYAKQRAFLIAPEMAVAAQSGLPIVSRELCVSSEGGVHPEYRIDRVRGDQ
jgi:hypothetical protein